MRSLGAYRSDARAVSFLGRSTQLAFVKALGQLKKIFLSYTLTFSSASARVLLAGTKQRKAVLRDSFVRLPPGLRRQHHASMKPLVLLLLAAATADDDVSGSSRLGGTAAIGGGTTTFLVTRPAQNVSAATAAIDRWFQFHTNNESYAPKAWTVTKPARRRAAAVARDRGVEQVQDRVSSHRER